jgi:putative toxin-antitoxin system antitoxin component (TIGR02293 family)
MAASTKRRVAGIEAMLGGAIVLYGRRASDGKLHAAVREGLPFRSFEHVAEALDLRFGELADLLGVASRTLARRKQLKTLSSVESDRLVGIARIASLAEATLGSKAHLRGWLRHANRALGGVSPLSCLDTEPGRRQVEDVLQQIRYGMHS